MKNFNNGTQRGGRGGFRGGPMNQMGGNPGGMMRGAPQQTMRGGFHQQHNGGQDKRQWQNGGQQQAGGDMNKQNSNYKTVLCKNFQREGACQYESKCMYAHGEAELRKSTNRRRMNNP
mmetsp:Transcript_28858/g.43583  ORF Transcript_28858/g.43583 Transcript_28858/m.43583 type:complete len:118 (+) Transcript_28858:559-912(+)